MTGVRKRWLLPVILNYIIAGKDKNIIEVQFLLREY